MDGRDDLDAILDTGRATRKRTPRVIWIPALLVGAACAVGFVLMMLSHPEGVARPSSSGRKPLGFSTGLLVGLAAGVLLGLALARYRHSSRKSP